MKRVLDDVLRARALLKGVRVTRPARERPEYRVDGLLPGDVIVAVNDDDVVGWPCRRLQQRIGDFRVPEGAVVRFTLARAIEIAPENGSCDAGAPARRIKHPVRG